MPSHNHAKYFRHLAFFIWNMITLHFQIYAFCLWIRLWKGTKNSAISNIDFGCDVFFSFLSCPRNWITIRFFSGAHKQTIFIKIDVSLSKWRETRKAAESRVFNNLEFPKQINEITNLFFVKVCKSNLHSEKIKWEAAEKRKKQQHKSNGLF